MFDKLKNKGKVIEPASALPPVEFEKKELPMSDKDFQEGLQLTLDQKKYEAEFSAHSMRELEAEFKKRQAYSMFKKAKEMLVEWGQRFGLKDGNGIEFDRDSKKVYIHTPKISVPQSNDGMRTMEETTKPTKA